MYVLFYKYHGLFAEYAVTFLWWNRKKRTKNFRNSSVFALVSSGIRVSRMLWAETRGGGHRTGKLCFPTNTDQSRLDEQLLKKTSVIKWRKSNGCTLSDEIRLTNDKNTVCQTQNQAVRPWKLLRDLTYSWPTSRVLRIVHCFRVFVEQLNIGKNEFSAESRGNSRFVE